MRRNNYWLSLGILILGGLDLGCTRNVVQNKQPADPLLVSKKPVEGKRRVVMDPLLQSHAKSTAYPGVEYSTTSTQRNVMPPLPPAPPPWPGTREGNTSSPDLRTMGSADR